jgi:hypothetical protein
MDHPGGPAYEAVFGTAGELVNGASWVPGPNNRYAVQFDGTDDYLEMQDTLLNRIDGVDMTLAFWIKPVNVSSVVVGAEKGNDNSGNVSFGFGWNTDGKLSFIHRNQFVATSNYVMQANVWQHVVIVRTDAGMSGANFDYYVDGINIGNFGTAVPASSNSASFTFGTRGSGNTRAFFLQGAISDVRLWVRKVPEAEALRLHTPESADRLRARNRVRVSIGAPSDDSLTIAGNASISVVSQYDYVNSMTLATIGDCVGIPGTPYIDTLSVDSISDFVILPGTGYTDILSVDGFSNVSLLSGLGLQDSLTIDGIAEFLGELILAVTLSINGICDITSVGNISFIKTVTIAGISDFTSPGGISYFVNRAIEAIADISRLAGFGYFDTLDIDGISDISQDGIRIQNDFLNIDGVADLEIENQYIPNITLVVAGFADLDIADIMEMDNTLTLTSHAVLNIENFYDILLATNVVSDFTATVDRLTGTVHNPSAAGSFSATCEGVFNRIVPHLLSMTQLATYKKPTAIVSQVLTFVQTVGLKRIRNETVAQSLTFTQLAEGYRGVVQTLSLSQVATCVKVISRTVNQTFAMTQQVARAVTYNLDVEQTLVFNPVRQRTTTIIGSIGGGNQTTVSYNEQVASAVLVPINCLVVIGTPAQNVVLPCPLFGDTQNYSGEMNLKRTMTGDVFTYVKKTSTEKLKYTFEIGTYKALELRDFLVNHSHEVLSLLNWKGETWIVFIVNNPFEFTKNSRWQPKGERITITLEFEGIKI